MDFKSLINKISSLNDEVKTVAAPELPKAVQLNEDAELRVLAGTSSYIAEAKKCSSMKEEEKKKDKEVEEAFDADSKPGDTFKTKTGTATKTKTGVVHKRDQYDYDPGSDDKDDKKRKETARKAKKEESIDPEAFKAKFTKMVEAKKGSKPDFLDMDKDGDKKEPMKKAVADKKKGAVKEGSTGDYSAKKARAGKDIGKPGKQFAKIAKKAEKGGAKSGEAVAGAVLKKLRAKESAMMPKGKKRPVKESVEQKLTFKQMVQLVQESGGQQQIDPIDTELFNWATRVATNKLGEGVQAELYAGLIYERNGGIFQMYDVLSESTQVDEFFFWDKDDFPKKKNRGPRDDGTDELARRQKVLGKGGLGKNGMYGKEYKEKGKYGDTYKIAGPKGKLPENFSEAAPDSDLAIRIQDAFGAIYDMGDDGLDYLNDHAPIYNQLFDKHNGDLDRIIAREKPAVLRQLADELEEIADGADFDLESVQSNVDEFFFWDKDDFPKKKNRGPRDDGTDELARRQKVLGKGGLGKNGMYGKEYKEKGKYGDTYKIAGPKGKLPENFSEAAPDSDLAIRIQDAFGAIYDMGDDGLDYLNDHAPIYNQLFDKHNGDLDRIIAREKPAVLRQLADELEEIADGADFDLESVQSNTVSEAGAEPTADDVREVLGQAGFSEEDVDGLLRFVLSSGIPSDAGRNLRKMLKTLSAKGIDVFNIPPELNDSMQFEDDDNYAQVAEYVKHYMFANQIDALGSEDVDAIATELGMPMEEVVDYLYDLGLAPDMDDEDDN